MPIWPHHCPALNPSMDAHCLLDKTQVQHHGLYGPTWTRPHSHRIPPCVHSTGVLPQRGQVTSTPLLCTCSSFHLGPSSTFYSPGSHLLNLQYLDATSFRKAALMLQGWWVHPMDSHSCLHSPPTAASLHWLVAQLSLYSFRGSSSSGVCSPGWGQGQERDGRKQGEQGCCVCVWHN